MSLPVRRALTVFALAAALFLALPAPSRAAGLSGWSPAGGLAARVGSWLQALGLLRVPAPASSRPSVRWEKEGGALDPNGRPSPPPPPDSATTEAGDPGGL
jgi:hypothetical protein